ncbi:MAG: ankyrin repeat domain-containing protein, partial [Rhodospirillales bacterium]|nr:ankyrin repeat domain-containing protein [Rhodospirillales bacterium]
RYVAISADRASLGGFDNLAGAEAAALAFGDGAHVVDTESSPYQPAVQVVEIGILTYVGHGSFDKRQGLDKNLVEAVKRGAVAAAQAFLARGASPDATDVAGGTALIWAVARGDGDVVDILLKAGANPSLTDAKGVTALKLAEDKGRTEIAEMLHAR